jgi:NitT/TauT family transport system ATP-binding protein
VRKIIEVPFGYPRTPRTQEEPRFVALRTEIRALVMEEYEAQARQAVRVAD